MALVGAVAGRWSAVHSGSEYRTCVVEPVSLMTFDSRCQLLVVLCTFRTRFGIASGSNETFGSTMSSPTRPVLTIEDSHRPAPPPSPDDGKLWVKAQDATSSQPAPPLLAGSHTRVMILLRRFVDQNVGE